MCSNWLILTLHCYYSIGACVRSIVMPPQNHLLDARRTIKKQIRLPHSLWHIPSHSQFCRIKLDSTRGSMRATKNSRDTLWFFDRQLHIIVTTQSEQSQWFVLFAICFSMEELKETNIDAMNATFKNAIHRDGVSSIQHVRSRFSNAKRQNPWNLSFAFAFGFLFDSDVRIAVRFANTC